MHYIYYALYILCVIYIMRYTYDVRCVIYDIQTPTV